MLRIYLTGEPSLLADGRLITAGDLPRRQGRLAFAYLVSERARPVSHGELADALWPGSLPAAYETALSALMSKLRALLGRRAITSVNGCYRLELAADAWVDTEAAHAGLHEAEAALRAGRPAAAYGPATVAAAILRRPFLPGLETDWVEQRRADLRQQLLRGLEVLIEVHDWNREPALARRVAEQTVALEPYRESGYRRLMLLHMRSGDRAEALRTYERCRQLLARDLGAAPGPETEAVRAAL
ncbi:MAG TPA: BTAD domain-containing putative transcriptional regulator [Candidatus Dormibacteraeota bacterium]